MESLELDLTNFDRSFNDLLILLKTIIKTYEKRNLKLTTRKNPIMTRLENYITIYDKTEPEEHVRYFKKIYRNNKTPILRGPGRDNWLLNNNVTTQFGEEVGARNNIKIHFSTIYNSCCKMRDEIEEGLDGLPGADQAQELTYPSEFLLHLYRIFYELAESEKDKERLGEHVKTLEGEVGVSQKRGGSSSSDPLGGLMNVATDLMKQMGIKIPEGQKLPSSEEFSSMLGNVVNNPQTKSMFGEVMKEMQGCDNIGDMAAKLIGNLGGNPAAAKTMQENLAKVTGGDPFAEGGDDFVEGGDPFADGDEFVE